MITHPDQYYTGVGSRSTPSDVIELMTGVASALESLGMKLRSGGADGADEAFESGVTDSSRKVIYLPWEGFNGLFGNGYVNRYTDDHVSIAKDVVGHWSYMGRGARRMHVRNVAQVLGDDCATPSNFLMCWTPKANLVGGTATAMKIAIKHGIPLYNMYYESVKAACRDLIDTGVVNEELWSTL